MIESILDAEPESHLNMIMSYQDNLLDKFKDIKFTDIPKIIEKNKDTLGGVYLTRNDHTFSSQSVLLHRWKMIQDVCSQYNIHTSCLLSPSNGYRIKIVDKIDKWKTSMLLT